MNDINNYKYKWKYEDNEKPKGCCYDCRLPYNQFQDMIIPDNLWEEINPTFHQECGILCPNCIVNRLNYIGKWYENELYILKMVNIYKEGKSYLETRIDELIKIIEELKDEKC